jgi:hypothetical protein
MGRVRRCKTLRIRGIQATPLTLTRCPDSMAAMAQPSFSNPAGSASRKCQPTEFGSSATTFVPSSEILNPSLSTKMQSSSQVSLIRRIAALTCATSVMPFTSPGGVVSSQCSTTHLQASELDSPMQLTRHQCAINTAASRSNLFGLPTFRRRSGTDCLLRVFGLGNALRRQNIQARHRNICGRLELNEIVWLAGVFLVASDPKCGLN